MTHNFERGHWMREGAISLGTGVLFGVTNTLVGHPFDTVKTKMQAEEGYMGKEGGMRSAIAKIYRTQGFRGFYRGCVPPLWGSAIYRSVQFAAFEALYTRWNTPTLSTEIPFTMGLQVRVILAGLAASTARAVIESPIEYAKVRRQTDQEWIFRQAYQGFAMQWARTGGLMTSYFIMIDTVRRNTDLYKSAVGQFFASGGCATLAFWLIWPFEVLKNQMQAGTTAPGGSHSLSAWSRFQALGGFSGMYRGLLPGSISIFARNGAAMLVMQWAHRKVHEWNLRD